MNTWSMDGGVCLDLTPSMFNLWRTAIVEIGYDYQIFLFCCVLLYKEIQDYTIKAYVLRKKRSKS